jgi:hypothetical protein
MVSTYGSASTSPYALSLDATITPRTRDEWMRHASRRLYVPRTFVSNVVNGLRWATPTIVCAAR